MQPWTSPPVPTLPRAEVVQAVRIHDTSTGAPLATGPARAGEPVRLYVCGVTPYDATHLGHAATYVAFDLLHRAWLDAGHEVHHVQNVTDVDDPLLERARATGVDWRDLAAQQGELFSTDMEALSVIAPRAYVAATEAIDLVVAAVEEMVASDAAYRVEGDTYFDVRAAPRFGQVSHLAPDVMLDLSAQRGGDPDRAGKRDPLDPLLWSARREGEPWWEGAGLGPGRPGWHVECTAIAREHLGGHLDVVGGGSDLVFPHHEHSAAHGDVLDGPPYAGAYVHTGMVGLDGEKMSKSKGNLVLVSTLRAAGVDPAAVRLAVLAHRYREDWSWTQEGLETAQARAQRWRAATAGPSGPDAAPVLAGVRSRLADDLDAPGALAIVDAWVEAQQRGDQGVTGAPALVADVVDALLGVRLRPGVTG